MRPRPAVCSSARMTVPSGSPAYPRSSATRFVESTRKKWRIFFANMLPFNCCRSMSGVSMSGTRSRKYPVFGLPFTRTPPPRSRSTQRQTVERVTPISFAMRCPLIAIVALFARSVSREASRRSVVPGREEGAMESAGSLLVLDGVYKQAKVRRGGGMGQSARRQEFGPGLGVGANVFERDASGNFHHTIRMNAASQVDALLRFGWRHVIQENGFGSG